MISCDETIRQIHERRFLIREITRFFDSRYEETSVEIVNKRVSTLLTRKLHDTRTRTIHRLCCSYLMRTSPRFVPSVTRTNVVVVVVVRRRRRIAGSGSIETRRLGNNRTSRNERSVWWGSCYLLLVRGKWERQGAEDQSDRNGSNE